MFKAEDLTRACLQENKEDAISEGPVASQAKRK